MYITVQLIVFLLSREIISGENAKFNGHIPETQKLEMFLITLTVRLREREGREREGEREREREKRERERERGGTEIVALVSRSCAQREVKLNVVKINYIQYMRPFDLDILDRFKHKL